MADEEKPLDPIFAQLGKAAILKLVAVAADRGMPTMVKGSPADPRALHAAANGALRSSAAELAGRAMQTAADVAAKAAVRLADGMGAMAVREESADVDGSAESEAPPSGRRRRKRPLGRSATVRIRRL